MSVRSVMMVAVAALAASAAIADELLYQYEADVYPYDESAGWVVFNPCDPPCNESIEDGHFVLRWPYAGDLVNYNYDIAEADEDPPPTLWVEWRFRSNHPIGPYFYTCDAKFSLNYAEMHDVVYMYGDAAVSWSASDFVLGLELDEFHTYRYESLDGVNYCVSVDGETFMVDTGNAPPGPNYLQLGGRGGCAGDDLPDSRNEWDMVRFGTIAYGEQIVATDPPTGFFIPGLYAGLDRFAVTFDAPNYVYVDQITVAVTGGEVPVVTKTRRRDNDDPETVEIVLDRPLAVGETTTFIFDDGVAVNVVEYTVTEPIPIPAVSQWGALLMASLMLGGILVKFARRRGKAMRASMSA